MHQNKKMGLGKKIGIGIGILFVIIIVAGIASVSFSPSSTQTTTNTEKGKQTTDQGFGVGDSVDLGDLTLTVNNVLILPVLGTGYVSSFADGTFVVVEVSIENRGKDIKTIITSNFKVVDSQDRSYDWSSKSIYLNSMGLTPLEIIKNIGPGLKTTGYMAFDVPVNDTGLMLEVNIPFSGNVNIGIGNSG